MSSQAYIWLWLLWKKSFKKRKAIETLSEVSKQVTRRVKAIFHLTITSRKLFFTRQFSPAASLKAYYWFRLLWKRSNNKHQETVTLSKNSKRVARHVQAVFHFATTSRINCLHTPSLPNWVFAGLHLAATSVRKELQGAKRNWNTLRKLKACG